MIQKKTFAKPSLAVSKKHTNSAKLTLEAANRIRAEHKANVSVARLADAYGVSLPTIYSIIYNKTYIDPSSTFNASLNTTEPTEDELLAILQSLNDADKAKVETVKAQSEKPARTKRLPKPTKPAKPTTLPKPKKQYERTSSKRFIKKSDYAEIRKLYSVDKVSIEALAERFKASVQMIRRVIRKTLGDGFDLGAVRCIGNRGVRSSLGPIPTIDPSFYPDIRALYSQQSTINELATQYSVNRKAIERILRLPLDDGFVFVSEFSRLSLGEKQSIRAGYATGFSVTTLAKRHGVSKSAIYRALQLSLDDGFDNSRFQSISSRLTHTSRATASFENC